MKKLVVGITAESSVVLIEGQLRYFKNKGYETYLLSPYSERVKDYCQKEGCNLLKIKVSRDISVVRDIFTLIRIFYLFIKIKPDIINLGTPKISLLGTIAGWLLRIKRRIYTCRGYRFEHEVGSKRMILIIMEKITARLSHTVICISPSVRRFGIENGIFNSSKSIVINCGSSNGFDLLRFSKKSVTKDSILELKTKLGISNEFVFGFVGRLVDRKGIIEVYEAFNEIFTSYADSNIKLLMVGPIEYDQISDKELINKYKKHRGIILTGSQQNIPLYLSIMDVFVLPAWWEGFGNVLVQAAAMGVPVISTRATGTMDAVKDDFNGILVQPKSVDQLVNAMLLLHNDEELRNKLGCNGPKWAKNFDNRIIWEGMKKIYENV